MNTCNLLCALPVALFLATGAKASAADTPTVETAIAANYRHWVDATQRKDVDAVLSLYDDDAIVLPPGAAPIRGKDAIRAFYASWYAGLSKLLHEQFTSTSLVVKDDLAVETADYAGESENTAHAVRQFNGKNLVVWKRQKDGSWKLFRDMWSASSAQ